MSLSGAQLFALAAGAGFPASQARIMAAIALAESGGNTGAVGDTGITNGTWGPSIGLWQIRSLKAHAGTGKERDGTRLIEPSFNARAARVVHGQQGFRAWSVYSSGKYGAFMDDVDRSLDGGSRVVATLPGEGLPVVGGIIGGAGNVVEGIGGGVVDAGKGLLTGLDAVGGFFGQLGERSTWVRVLQVQGGAVLVLVGLVLLGKDVAGPVASIAGDVIPQARAVKVAAGAGKAAKVVKAAT